ncbi:MAG: hypothetical protein IPO12_09175 [Flavobacteriales bacterium]|nr:hypothetical protein [Flavobacteriales bacterium]
MLRTVLVASFLFSLSTSSFAQQKTPLPIGMAPHEHALVRAYRDSRAALDRDITTPPTEPVRTMAEWEEIQSLVIPGRSTRASSSRSCAMPRRNAK